MASRPQHPHEIAADAARAGRPVRCAVLTVSDSRTRETDRGGDAAQRCLESIGHHVVARDLVPDDPHQIKAVLASWIADPDIDAIITTGGTGIARRDGTVEVVRTLISIELDGFGELFRVISHAEIGAAAMMSRAVGGLVLGAEHPTDHGARSAGGGHDRHDRHGGHGGSGVETWLFAVPGSVHAVETAVGRLIATQLAHLVWERRR